METLFEGQTGERLRKAIAFSVVLLGLFLLVQVVSGFMNLRYIGAGVAAANTISVSGHGESTGVPDIATFTFSVAVTKSTVAAAQDEATKTANALTAYLKEAGVAEKDIKTADYSVYPQYEYQSASCPVSSSGSVSYCPPGRSVLKGYEVRQTTSVKVRDTSKAGDLLAGVGSKGATEVSGLSFTFDDPDKLEKEARDEAITDAKAKADELAKSLGVSIVRIVSYNESGATPTPMYYKTDAVATMAGSAATPEISVGENKVTSDVSIVFEIR